MSDFRRRMMMQSRPRKAVAVRTVDGDVIPVLTLYDYELPGQVQDELYEENGKTYMRKNIVEFVIKEPGRVYKDFVIMDDAMNELWNFLKEPENNQSYEADWQRTNAFFHVIPESVHTCRARWNGLPTKPEVHIGIAIYGTNVRAYSDGTYTGEEMCGLLTGSTVRVAPNIEEQIKTYEVEEVIYE